MLCVNKCQHCVSLCGSRPWRQTVCVLLCSESVGLTSLRGDMQPTISWQAREWLHICVCIINADATHSHSLRSHLHVVVVEAYRRTRTTQKAYHFWHLQISPTNVYIKVAEEIWSDFHQDLDSAHWGLPLWTARKAPDKFNVHSVFWFLQANLSRRS